MGEGLPQALQIFPELVFYPQGLLDGIDDLLEAHRSENRQRVWKALESWTPESATQEYAQFASAIEALGVELLQLVAWQLSHTLDCNPESTYSETVRSVLLQIEIFLIAEFERTVRDIPGVSDAVGQRQLAQWRARLIKTSEDEIARNVSFSRLLSDSRVLSDSMELSAEPAPAAPSIDADCPESETSGFERKRLVDDYIALVLKETNVRVTKTAIWKKAGYTDRRQFEGWQRGEERSGSQVDKNIRRVLREKPHLQKSGS
jgi:hypothetical protein